MIGSDKDLKFLSGKIKYAIITVGQIKTAEKRKKIYNLLKTLNFKIASDNFTFSLRFKVF